MEALRAEVERQKREKTLKREKEEALFKSNDAKNNKFSAYASKKSFEDASLKKKKTKMMHLRKNTRKERDRTNRRRILLRMSIASKVTPAIVKASFARKLPEERSRTTTTKRTMMTTRRNHQTKTTKGTEQKNSTNGSNAR